MWSVGVARVLGSALGLVLLLLRGAAALKQGDLEAIDSFIDAVRHCRHIPGLSLAVVDGNRNRTVIQKAYGYADMGERKPAHQGTLFPSASTTKAFTATLIAMLVQDTKYNITWDTPVQQIMGPDFELYDYMLTHHTTIRDLLAHKTGIPDYFLYLMAIPPEKDTREKLIWRLRYHKPQSALRAKFQYNNFMYALAGYLAEKVVKGKTYEQLVREKILAPLGMTSSKFITEVSDWEQVATSYVYEEDEFKEVEKHLLWQTSVAGPAGSLLTNAMDMTRWLEFHLHGGRAADGQQLVRQSVLAATYQEEMPSPSPMTDRDLLHPTFPVSYVHVAYDMGWMTNIYRGYRLVRHSGGVSTYKTQVWFYPELHYGLFLSASGPPTSDASWAVILILQFITDILIGHQPWLNTTTACTYPLPWKEKEEEPEKPLPNDPLTRRLEDYVGTYNHPGFGDVTIVRHESSSSKLGLHYGQEFTAVLHYSRATDSFITNATGKYWYFRDQIPIAFRSSRGGGPLDILNMPLNSPFDTAEPFPFMRGEARRKFTRSGNNRNSCNAGAVPSLCPGMHGVVTCLLGHYFLLRLFLSSTA